MPTTGVFRSWANMFTRCRRSVSRRLTRVRSRTMMAAPNKAVFRSRRAKELTMTGTFSPARLCSTSSLVSSALPLITRSRRSPASPPWKLRIWSTGCPDGLFPAVTGDFFSGGIEFGNPALGVGGDDRAGGMLDDEAGPVVPVPFFGRLGFRHRITQPRERLRATGGCSIFLTVFGRRGQSLLGRIAGTKLPGGHLEALPATEPRFLEVSWT